MTAAPGQEPSEAPDEPRARVSARSVAIWGARTTGGIVGVAVAVVVAGAAVVIQPPTWSVTPPLVVVDPEPAAQTLVCAGAPLRLADDTGENADQASPIGDPPYVGVAVGSGDPVRSTIAQSDAGTGGTVFAPQVLVTTPVDGAAPVVAGTTSSAVAGGVTGLVATACEAPGLRTWVIGGSTQLGRTSILTIVNPTSVEAVVDLDLYGESGAIEAVGLDGIVVPAGSQRVVPVSGFVLEERAPVIGVRSTGGNVAVFVQESITRTLTPGGIDVVGQQDPASTLVIPGVAVAGEAALAGINTTEIDQDDTMPTLRLLAPSGPDVAATVALVPAGATVDDALANPRETDAGTPTDSHAEAAPTEPVAESFPVTLTAGVVTELPIDRVAPGEYTVVVLADGPVIGAVRASVTSTAGTDFAWYSPAAELGDPVALATPDTKRAVLAIANPTASDRSVTLSGPDGETTVEIPAGETILTPVDGAARYTIGGAGGLRAAVRAEGDGLVAQFPLQPPAALAKPVNVHV